MPFANAAGATIHYAAEGGGRDTLLLVMGLGGHASEWGGAFATDLASDRRVVRMDNRGIAQSQTSVTSWTMLDMAADVIAVVDALGLPSVHLAGTSMGGMVAQLVAAQYPTRVSRLVLMATTFGGRESIPPEPKAAAVLAPPPGMPIGEQRRQGLRALTSDAFADDHSDLIELLVAQRERNPTSGPTFKAQFEAILSSDRSQVVNAIRCPTLVIHGEEDPLVPVRNGHLLAERIAGAKLALLEGCGHLPHLERPEQTAKLIREFLGAPR
jgi:pimeloyl-ACP methyl ester carboxylesterase